MSLPQHEDLATHRQALQERFAFGNLVAEAAAMRRVLDQIRLAAQVDAPVLLVGEPGTGKEHLARVIHFQSNRKDHGFAAPDCRALPPAILDRLLTGPQRGGPDSAGTVYLQDLAHLPRDIQERLLDHVGREGQPRFLAGMAEEPEPAVRDGRLLEGLFFRMSPLVIRLPPLRERPGELGLLAHHFLQRAGAEGGKPALEPAALQFLERHSWPGNLDELDAVLRQAALQAQGRPIAAGDFPPSLRTQIELAEMPAPAAERPLPLDHLLENAERRLIRLALEEAKGNKSRAAVRLQISRARLLRRMQQLGVEEHVGELEAEILPDDHELPQELRP